MQNANMKFNPSPALPWYRHRWPWLLMLGPIIVVLAGIHTTWLAFTQQDALVVDDYYKQGKAINQDLRRDRVALARGMAAQLRYDAASGRLTGSVTSAGQPYSGAIAIRLVHSTQPDKDLALTAQADSQGNFAIALPMLEIARWQVLVEGAARDWRLHGVWGWPREREIGLDAAQDK
jgi:hypothetical protein